MSDIILAAQHILKCWRRSSVPGAADQLARAIERARQGDAVSIRELERAIDAGPYPPTGPA